MKISGFERKITGTSGICMSLSKLGLPAARTGIVIAGTGWGLPHHYAIGADCYHTTNLAIGSIFCW